MRLCMTQSVRQVCDTWDKQGVPHDSIAATSSDLAKASWWLAQPSASQQGLNQAMCSFTVYELQMHFRCNGSRTVPQRFRSMFLPHDSLEPINRQESGDR